MRQAPRLNLGPESGAAVPSGDGIQGLVSINDILEGIVGRIPSVDQPAHPLAVRRDDGSWLLDGALLLMSLENSFASEPLRTRHAAAI